MSIIGILVITSLCVFYLLFIGNTIMLYKKGIKVWAIGTSTKKILERILENILIPVMVLWSVFIVITTLNIQLPKVVSAYLIDVYWFQYLGIILCYAGLLIFLWALISFGKAWRIGIDEQNSNELITNGMFRYSRNPIFLFMDTYFLGITLIYPNIIFIVTSLCMMVGIHLQIKREEKFLERNFGKKYNEYKNQTKRYL